MGTKIKDINGVDIYLSLLEEDIPIEDTFDPEICNIDEIIESIENGSMIYFCAKVYGMVEGVELSEDYLGCCLYKSEEDFINNSGYFDDMSETVAEESVSMIKKLVEKIT